MTDDRDKKEAELRQRPGRNPMVTAEYLVEALNHINEKQDPMSQQEILDEIKTLTRLAVEPPDPKPE